ncbi:hypothetical protein [Paenibacillus dendritiformis]|uniref:hypothetical protein n=1 Tax=Paenibacillus dendritiformis TaxID=130049 RepID=UPI0018CE8C48|nr:hypothetical protein [Paenibacillus dendritiformis]
MSAYCKDIFKNFINKYKEKISAEYWSKIDMFNLSTVYQDHEVWPMLKELGANKMFIITAGLAIGLGYADATRDYFISFTEIHRQNDPYQLYRKSSPIGFTPVNETPGNWVVIDKVYTAGTINLAADVIREKVGSTVTITRVGLFPKSYDSLKSLDWFVYGGRIYRCAEILPRITKSDWHKSILFQESNFEDHFKNKVFDAFDGQNRDRSGTY